MGVDDGFPQIDDQMRLQRTHAHKDEIANVPPVARNQPRAPHPSRHHRRRARAQPIGWRIRHGHSQLEKVTAELLSQDNMAAILADYMGYFTTLTDQPKNVRPAASIGLLGTMAAPVETPAS
ncbi:hypothetical protein BH10PLA2_BH10PLA2_00400 [soil metagenome]